MKGASWERLQGARTVLTLLLVLLLVTWTKVEAGGRTTNCGLTCYRSQHNYNVYYYLSPGYTVVNSATDIHYTYVVVFQLGWGGLCSPSASTVHSCSDGGRDPFVVDTGLGPTLTALVLSGFLASI